MKMNLDSFHTVNYAKHEHYFQNFRYFKDNSSMTNFFKILI